MSNEVFLVTGASSDIGRELVARLCRRGDSPVILAHYYQGGDSLGKVDAGAGGARIVPLRADFRDPAQVADLAQHILLNYGAPRRIVHLPAARLRYERFAKMDWLQLQDDMTIQVHSIVSLLKVFIPLLRRSSMPGASQDREAAKIVFVLSSVTLGLPPKYMTAYNVVKYALLGLMRSIAAEYATEGISVNAVSPSMVDTQFLKELPSKAIELAASAHPLHRNATAAEVCDSIEFLLFRGSDYMNGVNLPLTGGLLA